MSDTNLDGMKTIPVLSYSGKTEDWEMWKEKHLAIAYQRGCQDILTGETEVKGDGYVRLAYMSDR